MDRFAENGYIGPVKVLTRDECRRLLAHIDEADYPLIPDWHKGLAVSCPEVYRVAAMPAILGNVKGVLGADCMLWGASVIRRKPGQTHEWHNDIEASVAEGRTVSVWIGLAHTSEKSCLELVARSHAFKESIQEVQYRKGAISEKITSQEVLSWAHERNSDCHLETPALKDGDALFFDGWLWHTSHNTGEHTRVALLLQYATPDTLIRIPDGNDYRWPFRTLKNPRPPCIMVAGSDRFGVNRIVPPPVLHDGLERQELRTQLYTLDMPLVPDASGWKPYPIFRGSTPNLQSLSCHASALRPGHTPHPPHQHREEEILIMLGGEADVTLPDLATRGEPTVVTLKPGDFVYYPAWFYHTITAKGDQPANYLMFKWYNGASTISQGHEARCTYAKYAVSDFYLRNSKAHLQTTFVFQGVTDCLARLHCHTTVLQPGAGYPAHSDAHDVAMVLLEGKVISMHETAVPDSVLFYAAGQLHDIHNPGNRPAKYLVLEFHGNHPAPVKRQYRSLWQKMKDPKSWKRKMKEWKNRLDRSS